MGAEVTRAERRAAELAQRRVARRAHQESDRSGLRALGFAVFALLLIGGGLYLAAADLTGQRGAPSNMAAIPVRLSMAGFTPSEVRVPAGRSVDLELWTTDDPSHLQGGVHTMVSDELGFSFTLAGATAAGESRRTVRVTTPAEPGVYDIYCDTCCGGKASPSMHGRLVVEA
jgi:plastocyanin